MWEVWEVWEVWERDRRSENDSEVLGGLNK